MGINCKFIYHVAVIDYLQSFNFEKSLESKFKTTILNRKEDLISAIDPMPYAKRFMRFMGQEVFVD